MSEQESKPKIAKRTGEIDRRTKEGGRNGNCGVSRGKDVKPRKRRTGYYVLNDEALASLKFRMEEVFRYFGTASNMVKQVGVKHCDIYDWKLRGRISAGGAKKIQAHYRRNKCQGFRASYCRPDLEFDTNGNAKSTRCKKRSMLRVVK